MARVGWLGTELGVGEVAKGHLRFILSGQLHRDQPTALCFALGQATLFLSWRCKVLNAKP
jgi:hypothetical protein